MQNNKTNINVINLDSSNARLFTYQNRNYIVASDFVHGDIIIFEYEHNRIGMQNRSLNENTICHIRFDKTISWIWANQHTNKIYFAINDGEWYSASMVDLINLDKMLTINMIDNEQSLIKLIDNKDNIENLKQELKPLQNPTLNVVKTYNGDREYWINYNNEKFEIKEIVKTQNEIIGITTAIGITNQQTPDNQCLYIIVCLMNGKTVIVQILKERYS